MKEKVRERPVVPFVVNEYLINLLAWMYLIPRRRGDTRTLKGSAKSRGSSYQRVNPFARGVMAFLARRPGDDAVIGLALQRERSCALPVVGFLLASSGRQSRRQGKKNGDDGGCVANPQTFQLLAKLTLWLSPSIFPSYIFHLRLC